MGGGITTKIGEYMRLPLFKLILLFFPLKGLRRCRLVSFLFAPCRRLVHLHKELQVKTKTYARQLPPTILEAQDKTESVYRDAYLHWLNNLLILVPLVCPVQHHNPTNRQVLHWSVAG